MLADFLSGTSSQYPSQPKNLWGGGQKIFLGKMFDFRRITIVFWDTASQSRK